MDKQISIKYLNKDFTEFRSNLINFAKIYYQDTINDFTPNDPASMFIDMASYVGDVLSYYIDVNVKEMMLIHANQKKNVLGLAQSLGYKPRPSSSAITDLNLYQLIPAIGDGDSIRPDYRYAVKIKKGMTVSSDSDVEFRSLNKIDFSYSSSFDPTEVSIQSLDDNGVPIYYLLKKTFQIQSGVQTSTTFTFTDPIRYDSKTINETNILSIDEILDSDGNNWYEVPYLAQSTIFELIPNNEAYDTELSQYEGDVPYLLKIKRVPKRFITRYNEDDTISLQFGSGVANDYDEEIVPNPDNVGLAIPTGVNKLNYSYDLANFLYSDSYGQVPTNTTLTVKYTTGGGVLSNVLSNSIRKLKNIEYETSATGLDSSIISFTKNSLACNNPEAASGGTDEDSIEDIRFNALANFAAQGRTVTKDDYIMRAYAMEPKLGTVSKAYVVQDEQLNVLDLTEKIKNPLALNMYVLSYNADKQLVHANKALKENLKVYMDRYRMVTDSINIKDAFVINVGVKFEITVLADYQANEVLLNVINELKSFFDIDKWQINQPIIKANIIQTIANVKGVQSVMSVDIVNLFDEDEGYFPNVYDIKTATKNEIIYPSLDPSIFEIRFLENDLVGRVITY